MEVFSLAEFLIKSFDALVDSFFSILGAGFCLYKEGFQYIYGVVFLKGGLDLVKAFFKALQSSLGRMQYAISLCQLTMYMIFHFMAVSNAVFSDTFNKDVDLSLV